MRIFGMKIFKEKAGVISPNATWVCIHRPYLYTADTFIGLIITVIKQWKSERNFAE